MYGRILVPTDRSEHAMTAARHAFRLAELHDATVHALYVIDTETSWLTVSRADVKATLREVGEDAGGEALAEVEQLAADYEVDLVTELREGTTHGEILDHAEEADVSLIVMGTHGREGVRRSLIGSVAERVVRESHVPVMTVHAESE